MSERDAFGNEPGSSGSAGSTPQRAEGGIAGLGEKQVSVPTTGSTAVNIGVSSNASPPTANPTAYRAPQGGTPMAVRTVHSDNRGSGAGLQVLRWLIAAGIAAGIVIAGLALAKHSGIKTPSNTFTAVTTPSSTAGSSTTSSSGSGSGSSSSEPAKPPVGLHSGSLILPAGLAKALKDIKGKGKLEILRVAPDRIDATLETSGGSERDIEVKYDGSVTTDTISGANPGLSSVPFSSIDTAAPQRILKHTGRHSDGIDYLVFENFTGSPQWGAYYKASESHYYFQADEQGKHVKKIQ